MKINIFKSFVYLLLFYLIYSPTTSNLFIFDKYVIIPCLTIIMLFYYILKVKGSSIRINKIKLVFTTLLTLSNLYYLIVYLINNVSVNIVESRLIQNNLPICYVIILSILFKIFKDKGYSKNDILNMIINLAVFQGIISLLMVIIPNLHNIALNLYYRGAEENIFISSARIYGISSDYTYATPIYHGFIASLTFYRYLITNNKKDILKCILITIAILLNGRTGLIIFGLLFIYYLFSYCIKNKEIFKLIKNCIIACLSICIAIFLLKTFVPSTYRFINSFINDTTSLIKEDKLSGNYASLKNSLYFPKGYKLIVGEGYRVFGSEGKKRVRIPSDIGYVNDIYMGGIIFCILLYGSYIYLINKSFKNNKILKLPIYITLIISNFKGEVFRSSIIIFLVIFICLLEVYNERISNSNYTSL